MKTSLAEITRHRHVRGSAGTATHANGFLGDDARDELVKELRNVEEQPLVVLPTNQTAESIIHDLLEAADERGVLREVAWCLVGAKLTLRFSRGIFGESSQEGFSSVDADKVLGDFKINNGVIKVAMDPVCPPDLRRIAEILKTSESEVWLLTRSDLVDGWRSEVNEVNDIDAQRVVVTSVEAFVGQSIAEIAESSNSGAGRKINALLRAYNSKWVTKMGKSGMRIVLK